MSKWISKSMILFSFLQPLFFSVSLTFWCIPLQPKVNEKLLLTCWIELDTTFCLEVDKPVITITCSKSFIHSLKWKEHFSMNISAFMLHEKLLKHYLDFLGTVSVATYMYFNSISLEVPNVYHQSMYICHVNA